MNARSLIDGDAPLPADWPRTLVIAVGNPSRGDDAAAPLLAERLSSWLSDQAPSLQGTDPHHVTALCDQQLSAGSKILRSTPQRILIKKPRRGKLTGPVVNISSASLWPVPAKIASTGGPYVFTVWRGICAMPQTMHSPLQPT